MDTKRKDLKWLSDLSGRLVREFEDEERRYAKMRRRMRAMARRIEAEAIAAEKKAKKK